MSKPRGDRVDGFQKPGGWPEKKMHEHIPSWEFIFKVYLLSILTIAILCIMITYGTVLRVIMMITIVINNFYGEVDFGEICLYAYIYGGSVQNAA